ncbi:hypothetical protein MMC17_007191 [Xylographa soralifera]|nr:hypothetical protein [Xylographa soralifera]
MQPNVGLLGQRDARRPADASGEEEPYGHILRDLYTECLEVLKICAINTSDQRLCSARSKLKLWGSGLFGQSSLVELEGLPITAANRGLLHYIVGVLADIASILSGVCETLGPELLPGWVHARARLLALLRYDGVVDQMFHNTSISRGSNSATDTIAALAEDSYADVDDLVDCLVRMLPSVDQVTRIAQLHAEIAREQQVHIAYEEHDIGNKPIDSSTLPISLERQPELEKNNLFVKAGYVEGTMQNPVPSSSEISASREFQSTAPSSFSLASNIRDYDATNDSFSDVFAAASGDKVQGGKIRPQTEHAGPRDN